MVNNVTLNLGSVISMMRHSREYASRDKRSKKEGNGWLYGIKKRDSIVIVRAEGQVCKTNGADEIIFSERMNQKRVDFEKGLIALNLFESQVLGGFHSHVIAGSDNKMGLEDIDYSVKLANLLGLEKWIEVVARFEEREYAEVNHRMWSVTDYGRKLRILYRDLPKHGYMTMFSAYELDVRQENPKPRELNVRLI